MSHDEVTLRDLLERDMGEVRRGLKHIGAEVRLGREAASHELAEVRTELRELRGKLDDTVQRPEFTAFKQHVYERLDAHDRDRDGRHGADRMLARVAAIVIGSATVGGILVGVLHALTG